GGQLVLRGGVTEFDGKGRYYEPSVVIDCPNDSHLMQTESFGPVIGIAAVSSEEDAIERINDSDLGLTLSLWTSDPAQVQRLGSEAKVGTIYQNRCDYLDPALPWTGSKDSGIGSSLGLEGFAQLTRPKSWLLRDS
ncbi:MAG: aldehyde dehydrogenase family protein, partial [Myxococcales bacterium]|nr:aldehyde dehydrogenase family protein [Myxococcales bacterium]